MKKIITTILLLVIFSINVDAKVNMINFEENELNTSGNLYVNNVKYSYISSANEQDYIAIIKYYNENNELINESQSKMDYYLDENDRVLPYQYYFVLDNDYSQVWKIKNVEYDHTSNGPYIYEFEPFKVSNDADIYIINHSNSRNEFNLSVKDGDLIIHDESYGGVKYLDTDYYQNFERDYYFIIGYDKNGNKIEDNYSNYVFYLSVGSCFGASMDIIGYSEPKFSVKCEDNTIKKNESTTCTFKVKSRFNINEMNIDLSKLDFEISDLNSTELFEVEENNNSIQVYRKAYKEIMDRYKNEYGEDYIYNFKGDEVNYIGNNILSEETEFDIFTFKVTSKKDIDTSKINVLFNVEFSIGDFKNSDEAYEEINVIELNDKDNNDELKNPETGYVDVAILLLITLLFFGSMFYILKKKDLMDEI